MRKAAADWSWLADYDPRALRMEIVIIFVWAKVSEPSHTALVETKPARSGRTGLRAIGSQQELQPGVVEKLIWQIEECR